MSTNVDVMACNALRVTSVTEHVNARGVTPNATPAGYGPSDLYSAYKLPSGGGAGQTVAIVDAYDDPNADPATGVAVYQTYGTTGWTVYGGTSVASPLIAAVYADAGTPGGSTYPAGDIYGHTGSLFDVTTGATASCSPAYLCTAEVGYDGPTGWGTPDGLAAFVG